MSFLSTPSFGSSNSVASTNNSLDITVPSANLVIILLWFFQVIMEDHHGLVALISLFEEVRIHLLKVVVTPTELIKLPVYENYRYLLFKYLFSRGSLGGSKP
jgi:phosphatidylinositol kinase/protein kinase (PI-3  family)